MDKNIYITKTLIENESLSELDFELTREFGFDYEDENDLTNVQMEFREKFFQESNLDQGFRKPPSQINRLYDMALKFNRKFNRKN